MPSGLKVAQQSRPGFTPVSPAPPSAPLSVPGKLYAVGGYDGASRQCLSTVEQYNPATNEWTYVADMSTRRSAAGTGGASGCRLCLICSQVGLETSSSTFYLLTLSSFLSVCTVPFAPCGSTQALSS